MPNDLPPSTRAASDTIEITLNGQTKTVAAALPVDRLIAAVVPASAAGVAIAVNDAVVPRARWPQHRLQPHDVVEIVHAVRGG